MKLNKKLIEQLRNGEIAVENSGTVEQLRKVLKAAFPECGFIHIGGCQYYSRLANTYRWKGSTFLDESKPTYKISDFYQAEPFTGWAKDDRLPNWMGYFKYDIPKFGFCSYGKWKKQLRGIMYSYCSLNRPATHEEIEKTLIKEAKRRGYKGGNTIKGFYSTTHFPEEISFRYEMENNKLVTDDYCVVFENGQWAEIIEQPKAKPKTNPIKYLVDGTTYSLDYQQLKSEFNKVVMYSNEEFMANLPQIAHLACVVAYFKGLGVQATISDKGIIHELIHIMTDPNEPTNNLQEIREKFNRLIQLV